MTMTEKKLPPNAGKGRTKGQVNKVTRVLKEALIVAAEQVGENGKGKEGLIGYLKFLARKEPKSFSSLLGRVIPLQITGKDDTALTVRLMQGDEKL